MKKPGQKCSGSLYIDVGIFLCGKIKKNEYNSIKYEIKSADIEYRNRTNVHAFCYNFVQKKGSVNMVTALNVGNNLLQRGFAEKIDITPMKLQKLVYFIYRDYLQKTGKALFNERFETWKYGPVCPSIYKAFKQYGSNAIRDYVYEPGENCYLTVNENSSPIFKKIIDDVWNENKYYDGIYLSSLTHREGTAWKKAYDNQSQYLLDADTREEETNCGR
mgnify:CR=1 FL=1